MPPTALVPCSLRKEIVKKDFLLLEISPGLPLGDPLSADLDPGLAESLDHVHGVDSAKSGSLSSVGVRSKLLTLSLVIATLGLELDSTARHDSSREHVAFKLLLCDAMPDDTTVSKRLISLPAR